MIVSILGLLSQLPQLLQAGVAVVGASGALLAAVLVICKIIQGEQPDAFVESLIGKLADLAKKIGK